MKFQVSTNNKFAKSSENCDIFYINSLYMTKINIRIYKLAKFISKLDLSSNKQIINK